MTDSDPSLIVPDLPGLARGLGSLDFPLRRTPPLDDDAPFRLAGERAHIEGGTTRGIDRIETSMRVAEDGPTVEEATVERAVLTPIGLERRLRVGGVEVVERIVVAQSDPVCFLEWEASKDVALVISWTVPGGASRWRAVDRGLMVAAAEDRALYVLSDAPTEMSVSRVGESDAAGLRVRATLEPGERGPVRLAVAAMAADDDETRVLRVMGRSHVVVPARRADARRLLDDRLALESPDDALSEALEWAKVALAGQGAGVDPAAPISARHLRLVLASLAVGDPGPARRALAALPAANGERRTDPDDESRSLTLAARYLAWTGDLRTMKAAWPAVRRLAELRLEALRMDESHLVRRALAELVPAAEEVGDHELADRLRSAVEGAEPAATGEWPNPGEEGADVLDPLLRAATMVEAVVQGLLGAEPDAPRGRLVLRPRLPAAWSRCTVRRLAVGGTAVEMDYGRADGAHRFTMRQTRGGAPLRIIFEPELEGSRLTAARVDGEAAELDRVQLEGRVRVPVQVVLDHERRVEVEIEGADA